MQELTTAEHTERAERERVDTLTQGIVHTARNLGQIAAYLLQTGAMEDAASFYEQAKALFEGLLGEEHPKTVAWKEDLFFLINAPAIQQSRDAPVEEGSVSAAAWVRAWRADHAAPLSGSRVSVWCAFQW